MAAHGIWPWIWFNAFVAIMLVLDLFVFHRKQHVVSIRESLTWTGVWIAMALLFTLGLFLWSKELGLLAINPKGGFHTEGRTAIEFLTAYLIEESLSMDNIFVFVLIFRFFAIPPEYQHKTLFWGILGAVVMRLSFIIVGAALLQEFHWVALIFGAILLFTGVKLWTQEEAQVDPEKNLVLRLFKKIMPITDDLGGGKFIITRDGKKWATRLLVALVVIETTDVLFAVDSVPAVLSVTNDVFIAYASNVFAILGLRALYFALAGIMSLFKDLHYGLSFILIFVGAKMVAGYVIELPEWMHWVSLGVVLGTLAVAMLSSVIRHGGEAEAEAVRG